MFEREAVEAGLRGPRAKGLEGTTSHPRRDSVLNTREMPHRTDAHCKSVGSQMKCEKGQLHPGIGQQRRAPYRMAVDGVVAGRTT